MNQTAYDVIIVGAGPAGIFAALELTQSSRPRVLMLDKGPDLEKRRCPNRETGRCMKCAICALVTGWGGSGAFSDGKLTLTTQVGGLLAEIRGEEEAGRLVREVLGFCRGPEKPLDVCVEQRWERGGLAGEELS